MHKTTTWWGSGRMDIHYNAALTSQTKRLLPEFEPVTSRSQGNNLTIAPRLTLYHDTTITIY